jgi:hypothetical protein
MQSDVPPALVNDPLPIGFFNAYTGATLSIRSFHVTVLLRLWRVLILAACISLPSLAHADDGSIRLTVVKGGWFLGANGGSGVLTFHGRRYPLSVGGIDAGLVFGVSKTEFHGRVRRIRRASDVAGVYGAGGAGAALGVGARVIVLTNDKGAVLELQGRQIGLIANLDLSGLVISLR